MARYVNAAILALIMLQLTGILTYEYFDRIERPTLTRRMSLHQEIVRGEAPYQVRFRVLIPFVAEATARGLQALPLPLWGEREPGYAYGRRAFGVAYLILNALAIGIFLAGLQALSESWFDRALSLFGTALAALVLGFTFRDHFFHPWSLWEAAFFSVGLLALARRRYGWFTLINVLGLLNRETSIFLILAFVFLVLADRRDTVAGCLRRIDVRFAMVNALLWLGGFLVLHAIVGDRPATFTLEMAVSGNLYRWGYAALLNALLFGPAWVLVGRGILRGPPFVRRVSLVLPLYMLLLLVIGFWWEIRYWGTALPIVIPALLASVAPHTKAVRPGPL